MNKIDITVLEKIHAWRQDGLAVVLVTVAHTWGSSPRPRGSMLAWCENGQFVGSVSGGCIEDDLLQEFSLNQPTKVETKDYGVSVERAVSRGLPCGGRLTVVIEPLQQADDTPLLLESVAARTRIKRTLNLKTGDVSHSGAAVGELTELSDDYFHVVFEADWRIVIIGAGELSQYVNQIAQTLGFTTLVCDPRENYRTSWPDTDTVVSAAMPDDFVVAANCDEQTAIVALTHDPKIDDMAILAALESPAFYVGALGSKRTNASRRQRLAEHFAVPEEKLSWMSGPIGIDLNTRSAAEIALSVVTEIVARRNGVALSSSRIS
ncbi:MAG: XdhC family protein [Gammaproteobacteria bacterium]